MSVFYPFGIPSTSSYAVSASFAQITINPSASALYADVALTGPPGIPGVNATTCPAGYTNALSPVDGLSPVPHPNPNVDRSGYILCFPIVPSTTTTTTTTTAPATTTTTTTTAAPATTTTTTTTAAPATTTTTTTTAAPATTTTTTTTAAPTVIYCLDGDGGSGCVAYFNYTNCSEVGGTPCDPATTTTTTTTTTAACIELGQMCSSNAQCCSNNCNEGTCQPET